MIVCIHTLRFCPNYVAPSIDLATRVVEQHMRGNQIIVTVWNDFVIGGSRIVEAYLELGYSTIQVYKMKTFPIHEYPGDYASTTNRHPNN